MATNEQEQPPARPATERLMEAMGLAVATATDTGPVSGLSLRVWVIVVGIAAIVAVSTFPLNVIGVALTTALALTLASRLRSHR